MCKKEKKTTTKDFPVVPVGSLYALNAGALGLTPGQGTRSHMPQLRVCILKRRQDLRCCNEVCSQRKKIKKEV